MRINLTEQFRCGGSLAYVQWVERLLGLRPGGPTPWLDSDQFVVELADSASDLEAWLAGHRCHGYGARLTAGYCWPWSDPRRDGTLVPDVRIGEWERPWNLKSARAVGGAPPSPLWASDPAGFGQVGCIYTAQGFEYDYAGVIIGPDLVWRTDRWVAQREGSKDPAVHRPANPGLPGHPPHRGQGASTPEPEPRIDTPRPSHRTMWAVMSSTPGSPSGTDHALSIPARRARG